MEKGIVYSVPKDAIYNVDMKHFYEDEKFCATCNTAIINGKEYLLHNEVSFSFKLVDGKIDILNGWHIGTEDFTFSKEEGDDCEKYIEDYHPGLLKQLKDKLKELEYI